MDRQDIKGSQGFTIVELMIAMLLGLVLSGVMIALFVENRQGFNTSETVMRMQDDARHAIRELANDLSMAGFWADLMVPGAISRDANLAVVTDCGPAGVGWVYRPVTPGTDESRALTAIDNATGAAVNASHSCIAAGEVQAGSDVIAIQRVAGARSAAAVNNSVYLRTNGTLGLLYREPEAAPAAIPAPFTDWEYRPRIYYVRNFAFTAGDGIPTLCRKVLRYGSTPTMAGRRYECLAQGVESLQVEFGLDSDNDGEPNVYVTNATTAQMQSVVAARPLLIRGTNRDIQYRNDKTYQISNAPALTPADDFHRRVFSVTVGLHNLASLQKLGS
jgi:Tfp pilus assembly protein PilW